MTVSVETEYHRFDADRARAMEWLMDALVADGLVSYERLGDLHKITHSGLLPSHDNIMTPEPSNEYQKLMEGVARSIALADLGEGADIDILTYPDSSPLEGVEATVPRWQHWMPQARAALSALKLPHAGDDGWQDIAELKPKFGEVLGWADGCGYEVVRCHSDGHRYAGSFTAD